MVPAGLLDELLVQGLHLIHEAVARRESDVLRGIRVVHVVPSGPVELNQVHTGSRILNPHLVYSRGLAALPLALRASMLGVGENVEASRYLRPRQAILLLLLLGLRFLVHGQILAIVARGRLTPLTHIWRVHGCHEILP